MEQHLSNSDFRAQIIEAALNVKDYKAKVAAEEGITKDDKNAPGPADQWRNDLLTTAPETFFFDNRLIRLYLSGLCFFYFINMFIRPIGKTFD